MAILIVSALVFFIWFVWKVTNPLGGYKERQQKLAQQMYGSGEKTSDVSLLNEIEMIGRRAELLNQSGIVGDTKTHDALMNNTYNGPLPEKRSDGAYLSLYDNLRILKIAGINHRPGIIRYKGRIECALVPEPANEFDPNAIKIVAEDSHHLGYIPSNMTDFVRSFVGDQFPYHCVSFIVELTDEDDGHTFYDGQIYIKKQE